MKKKLIKRSICPKAPSILIFILLTTSFLLTPTLSSEPTDTLIWVNPATKTVSEGDTFDITIEVDPAEPVKGVSCTLEFDPLIVTVDSVTVGSMFSFPGWGAIDNTAGKVTYIYGIDLSGTVDTAGILATVSFTAVNGGISSLDLTNVEA